MTDTLWHKPPAEPGPLPFIDRDDDGNTWTDLANNAEGRAACGYVVAPNRPSFDPTHQRIEWVDGAWAILGTDVTEVSMLQLELELADRGLTADVTAAVAAIGGAADIYWRRSSAVHRDHPMLAAIQTHLSWSNDLVDEIAAGAAGRS